MYERTILSQIGRNTGKLYLDILLMIDLLDRGDEVGDGFADPR